MVNDLLVVPESCFGDVNWHYMLYLATLPFFFSFILSYLLMIWVLCEIEFRFCPWLQRCHTGVVFTAFFTARSRVTSYWIKHSHTDRRWNETTPREKQSTPANKVTQEFLSQCGAPVEAAAWLSSCGTSNVLLLVFSFSCFLRGGYCESQGFDLVWDPDTHRLSWVLAGRGCAFFLVGTDLTS